MATITITGKATTIDGRRSEFQPNCAMLICVPPPASFTWRGTGSESRNYPPTYCSRGLFCTAHTLSVPSTLVE